MAAAMRPGPSIGAVMSSRRRNYILTGHRKDAFLEMIRDLLTHSFVLDSMKETLGPSFAYIDKLVKEAHDAQLAARRAGSALVDCELVRMCPSIGTFHTPLGLEDAFKEYDAKYSIASRKFVRPSFNEIRHILNLAQMHAIAQQLKLITLDGDCTLYADGKSFEDIKMAKSICRLLDAGVYVALVTAAGYGLDAKRYEARIGVLLSSFTDFGLSAEAKGRFFVLGGECHYLLRCGADSHLVPLEEEAWQHGQVCHGWPQDEVKLVLDTAHRTLEETIADLSLRARLIRKERAVGMIPLDADGKRENPELTATLRREMLDECVLRTHEAIRKTKTKLQFCAFNGGSDVWVDIGNKSVGVSSLQRFLDVKECESLHLGDQFSVTGNDMAARNVAATCWVIAPIETRKCLKTILAKRGLTNESYSTSAMRSDSFSKEDAGP